MAKLYRWWYHLVGHCERYYFTTTLTLAGNTGAVQKWQSSTDGGTTWSDIVNATTSQVYSNIVTTTRYRAVVKSGTCSSANSTAAIITVDPVTVAGAVTADATVCTGVNSGTLTLVGNTGTINGWESSEDNFVTSTPIANNTALQNYNNLTATTKYRAIVTSGVCPVDTSVAATITVDVASVGGAVGNDTTVCSGLNSGTLNLAGHTGAIIGWEMSTDNFATVVPLPDITPTLPYNNVTITRKYRAVIKSGVCPLEYSASATITADSMTVGGIVTSDTVVCSGANFGILKLSGNVGTIKSWQSSIDNFSTSTAIVHTFDTLSYTNLTTTTKYRAVVKSGVCPSKTSAKVTVTIDPVSVGGVLTADAT
ncbi:MAG: hypothetical protein NT150_14205, partial [Bacteroidetes bacterium]|nr:hypothetical protein [Bacteroidota bacterium]